jgi:hypothetical protein
MPPGGDSNPQSQQTTTLDCAATGIGRIDGTAVNLPERILFLVQSPRNERTYCTTSCVSVRPHILEATKPIYVKFDTIIYSTLPVFMALQPTSSSLIICVTPTTGILKVKRR